MAFLGKTYTRTGHENFEAFLKVAGVSEDRIKSIVNSTPSVKYVKNGDQYTLTNTNEKGSKDITFTPGVEFEDSIGSTEIPGRTTYTIDGNTITQSVTTAAGTAIFKRVFDGDNLTVTITGDKFDGVAKTFYKA